MLEPFDDVKSHIVRQGDRLFLKAPDGEMLEMVGYGGGPHIELDPRIDLCSPIYEQAERLMMEHTRREGTGTGEAA